MAPINLAHDIVKGTENAAVARDFYEKAVKEIINDGKPAYMQKLQFDIPSGSTADVDTPSATITPKDLMKLIKNEWNDRKRNNRNGIVKWEKIISFITFF